MRTEPNFLSPKKFRTKPTFFTATYLIFNESLGLKRYSSACTQSNDIGKEKIDGRPTINKETNVFNS